MRRCALHKELTYSAGWSRGPLALFHVQHVPVPDWLQCVLRVLRVLQTWNQTTTVGVRFSNM